MANGRCDRHGGKTPSKDGWHRTQWPKKNTPNATEKMHRKLSELDRAYKKRENRLAAMTKEQRAKYDKWRLEHPPGSEAKRTADRMRRQQSAEARKRMETPSPRISSPELDRLEKRIAELEAEKLVLERGSVFD